MQDFVRVACMACMESAEDSSQNAERVSVSRLIAAVRAALIAHAALRPLLKQWRCSSSDVGQTFPSHTFPSTRLRATLRALRRLCRGDDEHLYGYGAGWTTERRRRAEGA